jgi:hypothetical protein
MIHCNCPAHFMGLGLVFEVDSFDGARSNVQYVRCLVAMNIGILNGFKNKLFLKRTFQNMFLPRRRKSYTCAIEAEIQSSNLLLSHI